MAYKLKIHGPDFMRIQNLDLQSAFKEDLMVLHYQDLPAPAVAVLAAFLSDNAAAITTGIAPLVFPTAVQCVFAALWDGGDITIVGIDQFGRAQTETIADTPAGTVEGVKIWKAITSINQQTVGAGGALTCTVNTGAKIGLPLPIKSAFGVGMVDGVAELWTWDATYHGFTPTTTPDGSKDFTAIIPVDWASYQTKIWHPAEIDVSVSPSLSPGVSPT